MDLLALLDFFEPPVSISFDVAPEQALEYLHAKGLRKTISYATLEASEHASSFSVAKMTDMDLLADVKSSLEAALQNGTPFKQWANTIMPTLQEKGWWGKNEAGKQLGAPWRLETIFRTNMQSAYAVGEWQQIKDQEEIAPFLMYDAVDDHRTRPEHAAMDGQIHPVDSVFWKHYHPPNGYNCRCSVIQMSQDELDELSLTVSPPPKIETYTWHNPRNGKIIQVAKGTDPGFDFNPGQARFEELQKIAAEKAAAMSADAAKAAAQGIQATNRETALLTRTTVQAMQGAARLSNMSKAAERAAQAQIDKALAEKTPYMAKAIQTVQATKAGKEMSATELLSVSQEKAAKLEASSNLSEYKKAILAGKKPNAKAQGTFDALPEEAQQSMTDLLKVQLAEIQANAAAEKEILALVANPNSLPAKALTKIDLTGKSKVQVLEELKTTVAAQKAKQVSAQGVAGFKKSLLANKIPTAAQKDAFNGLPGKEQDKILSDIANAKEKAAADALKAAQAAEAAKAPPPQAAIPKQPNSGITELDPDDLVQTGPQGGSNPGGEFTDTSTGVKWYVKFPDNVEALRNEMLANQLYALSGVEVPEMRLIQFRGKTAIASRIVEGLKVGRSALEAGRVPGVQEHFGVDAWLADWDVIGPDFANTKLNGLGRGVRIDPGGSLRFRAMGGMKGEAFGNEVIELESMRNPGQNPHAAKVFRHTTEADIEDSVRRILAIPEQKIRDLVDEFGPLDAKERQKLLKTMLARREYLAKKYPRARAQAPEQVPDVRVTDSEQQSIEASRANGVTLPTDSDVIEDHQIVVTTLKGADGKPKTRMTMKLRPQAGQKLQATMPADMQTVPELADFTSLKTQALEFLKGIGALAKKGEAIRDKDIARAGTLLQQAKTVVADLTPSLADNPAMALRASQEIGRLYAMVHEWSRTAKIGQVAKAFETFDLAAIPDKIQGKAPTPAGSARAWKTTSKFAYKISNIDRGHITETDRSNNIPGVSEVREVTVNGSRVRYVPYGKGNSVTSEGYLQIDLDGAGTDVTRKGFKALDELNIPTARPSDLDRLELYLERIAAIRTLRNPQLTKDLDAIRGIKDKASRTEEMLLALNKDAGFDMRTSPNWNPNGTTQAFGHGRTVMMRPDFKPDDLANFERDYLVYTNPTGLGIGGHGIWDPLKKILESGGQFSSQLDRVRRGVESGGTSVSADHRTGGANYIFTRLVGRNRLNERAAGVYWKGRKVTRLDAFSYDRDVFGDVSRAQQESSRAKDLAGMIKNAKGHGNETNFRDSLSVFDDLEKIVMSSRAEYDEALKWLRANGYTTWPDGRKLEDVLDWQGRR